MANCPNCGHINPSGNRFCRFCGKPLGVPRRSVKNKKSRSFLQGKKLWVWVSLLILSLSTFYLISSKEKIPRGNYGNVSSSTVKPLLVIRKFQSFQPEEENISRGEAVALAVGEKLYSSTEIRIPDDFEWRIFSFISQSSRKDEIANTHILTGNIIPEENHLTIKALLKNAQGRILFRNDFMTRDDAVLEAADSISIWVKECLLSRSLGESEIPVKQITTDSWPAWRDYSEAVKLFVSGRWNESRWYLNEAVIKDSGFALGYRALAEAACVCGYPEQSWMLSQKAMGWIDRVSYRRRLQIEAEFFLKSDKTLTEAEKAFQKIMKDYPWDKRAEFFWKMTKKRLQSGSFHEVLPKAPLASAAVVMTAFPRSCWPENFCTYILNDKNHDSPGAFLVAAVCSFISGEQVQALKFAASGRKMSSAEIFTRIIGDIHLFQGSVDAAEKYYQEFRDSGYPMERIWAGFRLGQAVLTKGRFDEVRKYWTQALETAEKYGFRSWAYRIHCLLARMEISRSRYRSAEKHSLQAMKIAARSNTEDYSKEGLLMHGLAQAGLKQWSQVDRILNELKKVCSSGPSTDKMRYYYYLSGVIKSAGNIPEGSLIDFEKAAGLVTEQGIPWGFNNDQALFLNGWAEALERTGRREKALEVYKRIYALNTGRIDYGDIWSLSIYQQGRILDMLERKREAVRKYREFLNFWREAEKESWETGEARRRLKELESQIQPL